MCHASTQCLNMSPNCTHLHTQAKVALWARSQEPLRDQHNPILLAAVREQTVTPLGNTNVCACMCVYEFLFFCYTTIFEKYYFSVLRFLLLSAFVLHLHNTSGCTYVCTVLAVYALYWLYMHCIGCICTVLAVYALYWLYMHCIGCICTVIGCICTVLAVYALLLAVYALYSLFPLSLCRPCSIDMLFTFVLTI